MIKALNHLTGKDKQALAIFIGLAMLCSLYFASGILVTFVSHPAGVMEVAKDGKGFTVRVLEMKTYVGAQKLSEEIESRHGVPTEIEATPTGQGYLIKVGPLAKLSDAETLVNELRDSHKSIARIVQH